MHQTGGRHAEGYFCLAGQIVLDYVCIFIAILLFRLVFVKHARPVRFVVFELRLQEDQIGEDFTDRYETRFYYKIDEADLAFGHVGGRPVIELADGELVGFFEVALLEELNEDEIGPEAAQVPGFGRVGDVRQVEREFDKQLFVFDLDWIKVFVSHSAVQVAQLGEVLAHVGRQHSLNDDLAHALKVSSVHLLLPAAALIFRHQLEGGSQVMVLQHTVIIVPHRNLIVHTHQEGIVDPWMLKIMQSCADIAAHLL